MADNYANSFGKLANLNDLLLNQIVTPSNPPAGSNKLYFKNDDKLYKLTSAGVETEVGSGGGGANAALSNLAAVAINTHLLPDTDATHDLGGTGFTWKDIYFSGAIYFGPDRHISFPSQNIFIGYLTGLNLTSGVQNTVLGFATATNLTSGGYNTIVGVAAGDQTTSGFSNCFFGYYAGIGNTTGPYNAFFGANAGEDNTTGTANAALGFMALPNNTTGSFNTAAGHLAGAGLTAGDDNIFIGLSAGDTNPVTGNRNILIGKSVQASSPTADDELVIGPYINATPVLVSFRTQAGTPFLEQGALSLDIISIAGTAILVKPATAPVAGNAEFSGGDSFTDAGTPGNATFRAGDVISNGTGGGVFLRAGDCGLGTGNGGNMLIRAGNGSSTGGTLTLAAGYGNAGAEAFLNGGEGLAGAGGNVNINGGVGTTSGGNVNINGGVAPAGGLVILQSVFEFFKDGSDEPIMNLITPNVGANIGRIRVNGSDSLRLYDDPFLTVGIQGNFQFESLGAGIRFTEGSDAIAGVATLVGGTVTVNTTAIKANSRVVVSRFGASGVLGQLDVDPANIVADTSFQIDSDNVLDTSDVYWIIFGQV